MYVAGYVWCTTICWPSMLAKCSADFYMGLLLDLPASNVAAFGATCSAKLMHQSHNHISCHVAQHFRQASVGCLQSVLWHYTSFFSSFYTFQVDWIWWENWNTKPLKSLWMQRKTSQVALWWQHCILFCCYLGQCHPDIAEMVDWV